MIHFITYLWIFFKASLFSTGGTGNLPSLHDDLIARHWATNRQFAESLTIGQISPGPSGLWVISLGYLTAGVPGSLLALIAITIPPLLAIVVRRIYRKVQHHPAAEGAMKGLALSICGISLVVLSILMKSNGLSIKSVVIAFIAIALAASKKIPIPVILAGAAIIGIVVF
jgi:chromate transporter